jgi:hypothetical protein
MRNHRRLSFYCDLCIPSKGDSIAVIDIGCDQCIINIKCFTVSSRSGHFYYVDGPLQGRMSSSNPMEVFNGICKVVLRDNSSFLLVVNQALLDTDPDQSEALFQPHQLRAHGMIVDETATRHRGADGHPGKQMIRVNDITVPLYFDGWKTFLSITKPTEQDLKGQETFGVLLHSVRRFVFFTIH